MKQSFLLAPVGVIILLLLVLAAMVFVSVRFSSNNIYGEGFAVQWLSIRALVTTGDNPYSDQVSGQISQLPLAQAGYVPGNPPKYTSPLYSGVVVFPFTLIGDRNLAHALWLSAQLIAIFLIILVSLRITSWRPPWYIFVLFSFFTIFSYHVVVPWLDGGLPIWSALFLVLAFLAISQKKYEMAGLLLALSFIQPQMVLLPLIFTLLWSVSQRKPVVVLWFFLTLVFLSIVGLLLVPDWIARYVRLLYNFGENFAPGSPGVLFKNTWPGLGTQLGWLLTGIVLLIMLIEWWAAWRKDFRWYLWTVCLTSVLSQWVGIPSLPAYLTSLLLPFILISAMLAERWPRAGGWVAVSLSILIFAWEWAVYYLDVTGAKPELQLNLIIPLPLLMLIGLYWVRWWAIKPRRLLVEELKLGESY